MGTLDSNCWHVSGNKIVGGCFHDTLEVGVIFPGLVGSCAFSPFYQFGIMAWNLFPFPLPFCCCLLIVWRGVKKRLPLVRLGAEEGYAFRKQPHLLSVHGGVKVLLSNS